MSATPEVFDGDPSAPNSGVNLTLTTVDVRVQYHRLFPDGKPVPLESEVPVAPRPEQGAITLYAKKVMANISIWAHAATSVVSIHPPAVPPKPAAIVWETHALPSPAEVFCAPTPKDTIDDASNLLLHSDDFYMDIYNKRLEELKSQGKEEMSAMRHAALQAMSELKQKAAEYTQVTVFNYDNHELLGNDLSGRKKVAGPAAIGRESFVKGERGELPVSVYLEEARSFLAKYGVSISVGDPQGEFAWNLRGTTLDELDTLQAKQNLYSLIVFFESLPKELIGLAGLKHIVLNATKPNLTEKDFFAGAYADYTNNTMNINMDINADGNLLGHELTHFVDAATCGPNATGNDPQYAALNNGANYDPRIFEDASAKIPPELAILSLEGVNNKLSELYKQIGSADNPETREAITRQAIVLRGALLFASLYGETTIGEDKAEVENDLFEPGKRNIAVLETNNSRLEAKFIILFARLYYYSPQVATMLAIMVRPYYEGTKNPYLFPENAWMIGTNQGETTTLG